MLLVLVLHHTTNILEEQLPHNSLGDLEKGKRGGGECGQEPLQLLASKVEGSQASIQVLGTSGAKKS